MFDNNFSCLMDERYLSEVKAAYSQIEGNSLEQGVNPVQKRPLVISNNEGNLAISELVEELEGNENDNRPKLEFMYWEMEKPRVRARHGHRRKTPNSARANWLRMGLCIPMANYGWAWASNLP